MKFEIAVLRELKPDLFSRLIQKYTKANYSHVMVIVDERIVYHAVGEGVRKQPIEEVVGPKCEIVERFQVKPDEQISPKEVIAYMEACLGIGYALPQCFAIVFRVFRRLVRTGRGRMHCAEFVADVWTNGLKITSGDGLTMPDFLTQREVFEICKAIAVEKKW